MGPLSLGRPKWEGATWTKEAHRWRLHLEGQGPLRGNPRAPPPREETLGRPPRGCLLLQDWPPSHPPINRGDGGTPSTQQLFLSTPKGCPLSLSLS